MGGKSQGKTPVYDAAEQVGGDILMVAHSAPVLMEGKVHKIVLKFGFEECFMIVSRWNPEEGRGEVAFVGSQDLPGVLAKFKRQALARELVWKVDRFYGGA